LGVKFILEAGHQCHSRKIYSLGRKLPPSSKKAEAELTVSRRLFLTEFSKTFGLKINSGGRPSIYMDFAFRKIYSLGHKLPPSSNQAESKYTVFRQLFLTEFSEKKLGLKFIPSIYIEFAF
jgi:hypothetical protein